MMLGRNRNTFFGCKILLSLLLGSVSGQTITATVGSDATLRCTYDAKYHGRLWVCWGKGWVPYFGGCRNEVIMTNGWKVTRRASAKYQLWGDEGKGDVSLTIRQVQEQDSGMYGCRVYIPGWFNDKKTYVTLNVVPARPTPPKVWTREVKDRTLTVAWTPPFDGGRAITCYSVEIKEERQTWNAATKSEVRQRDQTAVTLMDLHPAKTYNVRVFAVNSVGRSDASNVLTFTTKEAAPEGPPLDLQLESLSHNSIRVSWKAPLPERRNGRIVSYSVSYREFDQMERPARGWVHLRVAATKETVSMILKNLMPSTKYGVKVQAHTMVGIGPAAVAPLCSTLDEVTSPPVAAINSTIAPVTGWVDVSTEADPYVTSWDEYTTTAEQLTGLPPDPPVLELKETKGNMITIAWTPAEFEGDSPINGFYLESKTTNASWDNTKMVVDFSANQTEATLVELHPVTYDIRMFAMSIAGTSNASNVLTVTSGEADLLPEDMPVSTNVEASISVSESKSNLLVGVLVPVGLVVLALAMLVAWKLREMKLDREDADLFYTSGFQRFKSLGSQEEL